MNKEALEIAIEAWHNVYDGAEFANTDKAIAAAIAAYRDSEIEALRSKLADCQGVIRHKGHDADCPARRCSFVGFTGRCGESPAWHKVVTVGHEYQSPPCYDACGHDRTTGEKA